VTLTTVCCDVHRRYFGGVRVVNAPPIFFSAFGYCVEGGQMKNRNIFKMIIWVV